jgi:hypothetical protein
MDPRTGDNKIISVLPEGVQDICWLTGEIVICGSENQLLRYNTNKGDSWFAQYTLDNQKASISRLAYDENQGKLAMVIEMER